MLDDNAARTIEDDVRMMSEGQQQHFPNRNGFALVRDLESPLLRELERRCSEEASRLGHESRMQWSRQWEYPFVLANLRHLPPGSRVLDAGCGYRFFPLLLSETGYEVHGCDIDGSAVRKMSRVSEQRRLQASFSVQDLERMDFEDDSFDGVTCISVLEHTSRPGLIVRELCRILRPGGYLFLTFDVSLDGERRIPLSEAHDLTRQIRESFPSASEIVESRFWDAQELRASRDLLTTSWSRDREPDRLPWRWVSRAGLRNLLRLRFRRPFFELAVLGFALRKPADGGES